MRHSLAIALASVAIQIDLLSATTSAQSCSGNALIFNGSPSVGVDDSVVTVPDSSSLDLIGDFTIEAWVLVKSPQTQNVNDSGIVFKATSAYTPTSSYAMDIDNSDNRLAFYIGDQVSGYQFVKSATSLLTAQWIHVACVRSATQLEVFVNGISDGVAPRTLDQQPNTAPLRFGSYPTVGGDNSFTGTIDEVRIWNVARTQTEIQTSMTQCLPNSTPGLVGYWHMDEQTGQDVFDSSPFANHGVLGTTSAAELQDPMRGGSGAPIVCVTSYCTAKVASNNCVPSIAGSAPELCPSKSGATAGLVANFTVSNLSPRPAAVSHLGQFFYSTSGAAANPFLGGSLCMKGPIDRIPPLVGTGGSVGSTSVCDSSIVQDFNARIQSGADAALVPGAQVWIQGWARDTGAFQGVQLSDALTFVIRL